MEEDEPIDAVDNKTVNEVWSIRNIPPGDMNLTHYLCCDRNTKYGRQLVRSRSNRVDYQRLTIRKKNAPFLYDTIITHALDWPTLTIQWFPDAEASSDKNYSIHRLLMGTHTSGAQQDYLQIAQVQLPNQVRGDDDREDEEGGDDEMGREAYDDERGGES